MVTHVRQWKNWQQQEAEARRDMEKLRQDMIAHYVAQGATITCVHDEIIITLPQKSKASKKEKRRGRA